ncbi:MAG TPA: alpha/beta hydrolase [Alphaproteobacteria bacterium]|jgi:pimeloyl-ACP methyl ester carboxylesterase|nr:alpha/beta hydrolase [Alphaproteobacteria bacterium]
MTIPTTTLPRPVVLERPDGATIAYHRLAGKSPGVVFLGGFMSDMEGTKALALEAHCREAGRAFLRFDHFAHGQSSGDIAEATVGRWRQDAVAVLDELCDGPQVLVGSSMGGWVALLAALDRPQRLAGLVGIAAAPDATEVLMWDEFDADIRATLERDGVYYAPSDYDDGPYTIAMKLIEEGRRHLILDGPIEINCPVRILQGMQDPDVPWRHALWITEALTSDDVVLTLVKNGDHRLSEPADIARLCASVEDLCRETP